MIEQTKTKPEETLEFKMNKQMETFPFNSPMNLVEENKWLLAVTCFETSNSVFDITDENKSFSITILGHWQTKSTEKFINELNEVLEPRLQKGIELHVKRSEQAEIN